MIKLDELMELPESGVYIVLDENRKLCMIGYSQNMGSVLGAIWGAFRGCSAMLKIESSGADGETLRLHTEYYREYYRNMGYGEVVAPGRKCAQYKVRMVPADGAKGMDVELVSSRGKAMVVGKFKDRWQAEAFIETCYGEWVWPVYAANSATKEFLGKQMKILDIR